MKPYEHNKAYLGDGVYVASDGVDLHLTTEDGIAVTNHIVIEPEVYAALLTYVRRLRDRQGAL